MREYSPRVRIFPHQRSSSDLPHLKQQSSEEEKQDKKKKKREKKKRIAAILNLFFLDTRR